MWDLSSPIRDWAHIPGIRRKFLNHLTTRVVPEFLIIDNYSIFFFLNNILLAQESTAWV